MIATVPVLASVFRMAVAVVSSLLAPSRTLPAASATAESPRALAAVAAMAPSPAPSKARRLRWLVTSMAMIVTPLGGRAERGPRPVGCA